MLECNHYCDYHQLIYRQMGQQESSCQSRQPIKTHRSYEPPLKTMPEARTEHEGLLRLQSVPFKNSIEINCNREVLFLENVDITLKYLIDSRLHSTKLFPFEDMQRLIESVTFTLAYLQSKGITYRDVCSDYMHYDEGSFKLLPNELIEANTYEKLIQNERFTHASPELIIAMRYGEKSVTDEQILQKSNVFCLGMMLLETTTLLPASQCYDPQTYDILDSVINERIVLVEQFYDEKIARIIANMLDYDYSQRMTLKELAVWVNREFKGEQNPKSKNLPSNKSNSQVSLAQNSLSKSKAKNNSVYMQPKEDKDEKNKVYLADNQYLPKSQYTEHPELPRYEEKRKTPQQIQRKKSTLYLERDLKENRQRGAPISKQTAFTSYENPYSYVAQAAQKKTVKYANQIKESGALKERNRFYPAVEDIFKGRPSLLKEDYSAQEEDSQPTAKIRKGMEDSLQGDRSINRIKEEIQKSRRLIEQFRRNEGIKH